MTGDPRWIRRLDAVYALALSLYPRRFRAHWEQPMRQAFRDRCREIARGQRPATALLTELLPDFAIGLGRERIHDLGESPMSKRHVLLALLVLMAGTIAMHERIGIAGNAAIAAWKTYRAHAHAQAERDYWTELAQALEPARTPREHTLAAVAWQAAGFAGRGLEADAEAAAQAQQAFDAAVAGEDPAALWLAATDCPVARCDEARAIEGLQRLDPGNAAVAMLAFAHADEAGDAPARAQALQLLATSRRYHGYDTDLMQSLLEVDARADAPRHATADELVAGLAMAWALPDIVPLVEACSPGAAVADQCRVIGRTLADGDSFIARVVGLKLWNRFAFPGEDTLDVHRRIRDFHWMIAQQDFSVDRAARERWRKGWLDGGGEVSVMQASMVARGVPLSAPATFRVDPRFFDPAR